MRLKLNKRDKNVHFHDQKDPYNDKINLNITKASEILPIDSKFLSSDEESDIGKVPVKKIKVHKDNIFSKKQQNVDLKTEM